MKKFNIKSKSFSPKINSEKDFRDYAHVVMKEAHGDSYDVDTTNKVVDDLIKDNPDADYGELIGRLTSGFGDKSFSKGANDPSVKFTEKEFSFNDAYAYTPDELSSNIKKLLSLPSSKKPNSDIVDCSEVLIQIEWNGRGMFKSGANYKKVGKDEWRQHNTNSIISTEDLINELSEMYSKHKKDNPLIIGYNLGIHNRTFSNGADAGFVTCETTNPTQLLKILNAIKEHGNIGHSFEVIVDAGDEKEEKFSWDGDGADRIESIETDDAKLYSEIGAVVLKNSDGTYEVVSIQDERDEERIREYRDKEGCKVVKRCDSTREADDYIDEHGFERAYSSTKEFGIKDNLKKWTVESLAELTYDVIEDNKLIQEAFKGYKGSSADDLKKFMKQYHIGVVDALATLVVIFEFGFKNVQKNYSELTVDNDPSILNQEKPNLDSKSLTTKREGMNMNWSVQNPFNLSIEPWLVANVINGKADGLYVGSLLGDSIDLGSDHISLDIKLGNSQPTDVFVIIREGKAIIFKASQLSKKSKSFSIGNYDYRFSIIPTEVSYEMQYLIGSWMMAASICHLYHICDNKYAGHVALDEFYKEFPEKVDALAEHFLADNEKAEFRLCVVPGECPIDYLTRLLQFTLKYVELNEGKIPSSYQSQLDEIVCFTQSILYKLKRLDSGRRIFSIKNNLADDVKSYSVAEIQKRMKLRNKPGYAAVALATLLRDYGKLKQSDNNQELYRNFMMDLDGLMIELGSLDKQTLINKAHIEQYAPLAMPEVDNFIRSSRQVENMKTVAFANIYRRFKEALWTAI